MSIHSDLVVRAGDAVAGTPRRPAGLERAAPPRRGACTLETRRDARRNAMRCDGWMDSPIVPWLTCVRERDPPLLTQAAVHSHRPAGPPCASRARRSSPCPPIDGCLPRGVPPHPADACPSAARAPHASRPPRRSLTIEKSKVRARAPPVRWCSHSRSASSSQRDLQTGAARVCAMAWKPDFDWHPARLAPRARPARAAKWSWRREVGCPPHRGRACCA